MPADSTIRKKKSHQILIGDKKWLRSAEDPILVTQIGGLSIELELRDVDSRLQQMFKT